MGVKLVVAVLGFLLVQEISAQRLIDQMQDLTVREGESVVLLCRFSSQPVDCLWTRGGIVINPRYFKGTYDLAGNMEQGDCSLRIAKASFKEDNSLWTCQIPPTLNSQVIQSRPAKLTVMKFAGFEYALIGGIAGAAIGGLILIALIIYCSYRYRTLCFSAKEKEDEEGGETDVENAANADSKDKNLTITADDAQNGKLDGQVRMVVKH